MFDKCGSKGQANAEPDNDGRMPQREKEADRYWAFVFLHKLARDIINSGNMVSVNGVAQAKTIGQDSRPQKRRMWQEADPGDKPDRAIESDKEGIYSNNLCTHVGGTIIKYVRERGWSEFAAHKSSSNAGWLLRNDTA